MNILRGYIADRDILWLIERVIESFSSTQKGKGLPLGNLTSQLLVNVYMNELDQFIKHSLKAKQYIRYADDFVVLSPDKRWLEETLPRIDEFLKKRLTLELHPDKVSIATVASGVDFLGWIHFTDYRVLRATTKRRALRVMEENPDNKSVLASYLGLMNHGNAHKSQETIKMKMRREGE